MHSQRIHLRRQGLLCVDPVDRLNESGAWRMAATSCGDTPGLIRSFTMEDMAAAIIYNHLNYYLYSIIYIIIYNLPQSVI